MRSRWMEEVAVQRGGGSGMKVGHYGSLYDSSLSLLDRETQMELYFEPEGVN